MSIVKTKEIPEIKIQSFYFEILPSDMFPAEVYLTWCSAVDHRSIQEETEVWREGWRAAACEVSVDAVEMDVWGLWTTVHVCPCELWGGCQLVCVCSEVYFKVRVTSSDSCSHRGGTGWGRGALGILPHRNSYIVGLFILKLSMSEAAVGLSQQRPWAVKDRAASAGMQWRQRCSVSPVDARITNRNYIYDVSDYSSRWFLMWLSVHRPEMWSPARCRVSCGLVPVKPVWQTSISIFSLF